MSEIAIRVEKLSKRYRIGALKERYYTFRDALSAGPSRLRSVFSRNNNSQEKDMVWALRDISFEVKQGEVVGIIGRNGAGKTTLLKVLTRITPPTEGRANIYGRVASLLEVGTGFHPELSGRENIYLNGAILGMSKREIERKFDEIVAFAEIEKFIDTPVKRYSSGMYVRLAFAVAAHLEPEILLVDEVLAVGDASFQKKCLGKMGKVAKEGRTVLFVSHNMGTVRNLCPRSTWLEKGEIKMVGETSEIINKYLQSLEPEQRKGSAIFPEDKGKESQLRAVHMVDQDGNAKAEFSCDEPVIFKLIYKVRRVVPKLYGCFQISSADGTPALVSYSYDRAPNVFESLQEGTYCTQITISPRTLAPGYYRVQFSTGSAFSLKKFIVDDPGTICSFRLNDFTSIHGNKRHGFFSTLFQWKLETIKKV